MNAPFKPIDEAATSFVRRHMGATERGLGRDKRAFLTDP